MRLPGLTGSGSLAQGGAEGPAEPAVHNAVGVVRAAVSAGRRVSAAHVRAQEPHQRLRLRPQLLPRQLPASPPCPSPIKHSSPLKPG